MKKVLAIDIKSRIPEIKNVPDNYIQCTVSLDWFPPSEFCDVQDGPQTRTNCSLTYQMKGGGMKEFGEASKNITKSRVYTDLAKELKLANEVVDVSISVQELIDALQKMKPTDRLVIAQEGYYADGQFGFFDDINDLTPVKGIGGVFKLGYSIQNY